MKRRKSLTLQGGAPTIRRFLFIQHQALVGRSKSQRNMRKLQQALYEAAFVQHREATNEVLS